MNKLYVLVREFYTKTVAYEQCGEQHQHCSHVAPAVFVISKFFQVCGHSNYQHGSLTSITQLSNIIQVSFELNRPENLASDMIL